MKIERQPLLAALDLVKPALATKDLIEGLSHVWFDGKVIMAYNDAELGIQVPLDCPFEGGIKGSLLIGLLQNSLAKEVIFEESNKEAQVFMKAGKVEATLSVLTPDQSPWRFPASDLKKGFEFDEEFVRGLSAVMVAVGNDASVPETLGVTFIGHEGGFGMYSTDTKTIAVSKHKGSLVKAGTRRIAPKVFCEQLVKLCPEGGTIEFRSDCILAENPDGVMLYARIIASPRPQDFEGMVAKHSKWNKKAEFPIPGKLTLALERMQVLFEGMVGENMSVALGGGSLSMSAQVKGRGKLSDMIPIPEDVPDVSFKTEPYLLKRALDLTTKMACTEDAVVFVNKETGFIYLSSNSAG